MFHISTELYVLAVLSLLGSGLQAPTNSLRRETNNTEEATSCPGYQRGNPRQRSMGDCLTGNILDPVDHMTAFGFNRSFNPDWNICEIPELPEANHRICYKTIIDLCGYEYRVFLNRRNIKGLQRICPHETEALRSLSESDVLLQSPRYGCRKGRGSGKLYGYRNSDLCLYNISIPSCVNGTILVESISDSDHEIEPAIRNKDGNIVCTDYLQIYHNSSTSQLRYCANDLSLMQLQIPATQFLAIFWTDTSVNEPGFKLRASCL